MRPPEINSGRIYSGPGPELMVTAATAWDALAAHLCDVAAGYAAATGKLATGWQGPMATTTTRAAAHYHAWLKTIAVQARQTAVQAKAAAAAYEAAFAAVAPPPVIQANRANRISLASANFFGQTSTDIADIEADYEQMWAQDADAMYAYAAASADAVTVTPFSAPPPAAVAPAQHGATVAKTSCSWRVKAAPEVVSAGQQVMSAIAAALRGLSTSPLSAVDASLLPVTAPLSKLSSLSAPLDCAIKHLNSLNKAASLRRLLPDPGGAGGTTILAGVGRGVSVGPLTVPRAWPAATATTGDIDRPRPRGPVGEPIRLVAVNEPPRQPARRTRT